MDKEQGVAAKEFDWVELKPEKKLLRGEEDLELGFRMFLVQVKSETGSGKDLHHHPLEFFRNKIPEMGIPKGDDVRAMTLRVNAERSANPRHRSELWVVIPGSTTAVGIQYKHAD